MASHPQSERGGGEEGGAEREEKNAKLIDASFLVTSIKKLGKTREVRLTFHFATGSLCFSKFKNGQMVDKMMPCSSFLRLIPVKDKPRELKLELSRKDESKRHWRFAAPLERDRFVQLMEAVNASNGRAYRLFCELDKDGSGMLEPPEVDRALGANVANKGAALLFTDFLLLWVRMDKLPQEYKLQLLPTEKVVTCDRTYVVRVNGEEDAGGRSRGLLLLTNFRLAFEDYRDDVNSFCLPFGTIHTVVKAKEKEISIHTKDDHRLLRLAWTQEAPVQRVDAILKRIQANAFPDGGVKSTFAYMNAPQRSELGWTVYDAMAEFNRLGFTKKNSVQTGFRICFANIEYKLSPTYPPLLLVPAKISDGQLKDVASYRSKARIPACVWRHPKTLATLMRCAQPLVGLQNHSNVMDRRLFRYAREANPTNNGVMYVMDARPYKAAVGNQVMGKGFEKNYEHVAVNFLNIDNIHAVRTSLERLCDLCHADPGSLDDSSYHSRLLNSHWLFYVRLIMQAAVRVALMLSREGASVVVHCSDGWDRTSQLTSLAKLMLDPYYRTKRGFAVLVEMEWRSFGHKFRERYGQACSNHGNDQRSPVFLQWLDCVHQLTTQFPVAFEFNEAFLVALADALFSCEFGTFLHDCAQEAAADNVARLTRSVWSHLVFDDADRRYTNVLYQGNRKHLLPSCSPRRVVLWRRFFLRHTVDRVRDDEHETALRLLAAGKLPPPLPPPQLHPHGEQQQQQQQQEELQQPQKPRGFAWMRDALRRRAVNDLQQPGKGEKI